MKDERLDFEEDMKIDPDALDVELLHLANLYAKYAKPLAEAEDALRKVEEEIKVCRSELILKALQGKVKKLRRVNDKEPTGQAIEAYYRRHPDYVELKGKRNRTAFEVDMLKNAVFGVNKKTIGLQELVKLLLGEYFAGPKLPRDLTSENLERARREEARSKVKEKLSSEGKETKRRRKK